MGNYLFRLLFARKLEVVIVGLGNCGKTTLLHVLSDGVPVQTVPTVGLNMELHRLLEDKELARTAVLVVANKIDLEPHASEPLLIRELNLDYIVDNPWMIIPCSALKTINIEEIIQWLIKEADKPSK
eukprot:gene26242-29640_t